MTATTRIPITRPYVHPDDLEALREPLETGWLAMGPAVEAFEARVAEVVQTPAVAVSSATAAMHLALAGWEVGAGDEVVVPAFSFVATAHAVAHSGATPVFCDVEEASALLDAAAASALVGERTRALLPVQPYGVPASLEPLVELARRHDLRVLEDAACALGATVDGRPCGSLADASAFSFHPRKIVTMGEGGILSSADEELRARARVLRNHGASMSAYDREKAAGRTASFDVVGFNYRLTDLQARLGLPQLDRLDEILRLRRALAAGYAERLSDLDGLLLPHVEDGAEPCWQTYVLRVVDGARIPAGELLRRLDEQGIAAIRPFHVLPALGAYREAAGWRPGMFPVAERLERESVAIPLYPGMTEDEQERVVRAIREELA
jgi:perosamine synthetase